jgi:hypothetical protein
MKTNPVRPLGIAAQFSRSVVAVLALLAGLTVLGVHPARASDETRKDDSNTQTAVALHWLADWDARNWEACWNGFSPEIKANIRLYKWDLAEGYYKDRLGGAQTRKYLRTESTLIPGNVVIVEFEVTFEHKGLRNEGVYLEKQPDGSWSVYALVNKPVNAMWPRQWGDVSAATPPLDIHWTPGLYANSLDSLGSTPGT